MTETPLQDVGRLSSGIAKDIGQLGNQAGELLKIELREQLSKALQTALAMLPIACGVLVGLGLLGSALGFWAADAFRLSPAAAFGLVGGVVLGVSVLGAFALRSRARKLRFLPSDTVGQIKEDFSWMMQARRSH